MQKLIFLLFVTKIIISPCYVMHVSPRQDVCPRRILSVIDGGCVMRQKLQTGATYLTDLCRLKPLVRTELHHCG